MADSNAAVTAYQAWISGDIDEHAALRAMQTSLDNADRMIAAGEGQRALWRKRISEVIDHLGGKASVDGLADYRITEPSRTISYERVIIEELLHATIVNGDSHYTATIEAARKVSERPGILMIRKRKI